MGLFGTSLNLGSATDFLGITSQGEQRKAQQAAIDAFRNLDLPDLDPLVLEEMVQTGELTPENAQAILQEQSQMKDIYVDPRIKQAQMDALNKLGEISSEGGLTSMDKAQLGQIGMEEDRRARGAREAILQNARERGIQGSGLELLANLQAQQGAASNQSQRDLQVAADAQKRALDAISQAGTLGTQMGTQEWTQKSQQAAAQDAINKFNAANRQDVEFKNIAARNAAQEANLKERQRIAEENVANRNLATKYNVTELPQKKFENAYKRAGGMAPQYTGLANIYGEQSKANQALAEKIGDKIQNSAAGAALMGSDIKEKKDIQSADNFDIDNFLNNISAYKYSYKDPEKYGKGERVGIMAQDAEKSPLGADMVEEDKDGTKMIDIKKATSTALAAIARLNERLHELEGK